VVEIPQFYISVYYTNTIEGWHLLVSGLVRVGLLYDQQINIIIMSCRGHIVFSE